MRRAARTDDNHADVVEALTKSGMRVQTLAAVGKGVPDLLVGFRGINCLLEVKDGDKVPSARRLTADEMRWHGAWAGQVIVVESAEDAVVAVIEHARQMGRI